MIWERTLFVVSAVLVLYTWAGYPLALWLLSKLAGNASPVTEADNTGNISIIVAAYNEAGQIAAKLDDCLALDYPSDRMELLVVSDGSTDATEEIVQTYAVSDSRIRLLRTPGRTGKSGAQNLAVHHAHGDILLFTDAGARFQSNMLQHVARRFHDASVGLVAPVVYFGRHANAVSRGQSAYWRFELWLRQMESELGVLATASGAAFAMRRDLFCEIDAHFGDDCVLPLDVCLRRQQVVQEAQAVVFDEMPHTVAGELRTRVRMTTRSCAGTLSRLQLLNPIRFPAISWALFSHKILRWMTPIFLVSMLAANVMLAPQRLFVLIFILQGSFYAAALAGWRVTARGHAGWILGYPFAFCLANVGFLLGTMCCVRGTRVVTYK